MYLMDGENEERKEDFNETVSLDGDPSYYVIWKLHQQTLVLRTDTTNIALCCYLSKLERKNCKK